MPGKLKRKASEISPDPEDKTKTPSNKLKKMKMNDDQGSKISKLGSGISRKRFSSKTRSRMKFSRKPTQTSNFN